MSIALAEADKYDMLEKIGKSYLLFIVFWFAFNLQLTFPLLGCGSFGIIRKVKRKSDGFVRISPKEFPSLMYIR